MRHVLVNYAVVPARGAPVQAKQEYKISFRTEPSPTRSLGENTFHVSVTDSAEKSISDVTVKITLVMPAMPEMGMAEMKVTPTIAWNGSDYSGKANIPSAGLWNRRSWWRSSSAPLGRREARPARLSRWRRSSHATLGKQIIQSPPACQWLMLEGLYQLSGI
jgi:hypothetical protein